jgi:hypothetical protein
MGNRNSTTPEIVKQLERCNPIIIQSKEQEQEILWKLYLDEPLRLEPCTTGTEMSFSGYKFYRYHKKGSNTVEYRGESNKKKGNMFRLKLKRYSDCHYKGAMKEGNPVFALKRCAKVVVYTDGR